MSAASNDSSLTDHADDSYPGDSSPGEVVPEDSRTPRAQVAAAVRRERQRADRKSVV